MDRSNKKLLSNIIYSGLFQLLFLLGPIITTPYVARIFTPKNLGLYGTSYTLAMFFVQLASFGIPFSGSRRISRVKNSEEQSIEFFNIWKIQALTTIMSFFAYIFIVLIFIRNNRSIYLYQSLLILSGLFDISWFYIGIEEIKKNIFRNSISKIITICLIFTLVKTDASLILYTVINIIGVLLGNLTMILQLKKYVSFKKFKKASIKKTFFFESFGLLIPQTVDSVKNVIPRLLLANLINYTQAGLYDQGLKIVTMLNGILQSVTTAIMPRITYLVSQGEIPEALKLVKKITSIGVFVATTFICGVFSVAEFFVPIFFGSGYDPVIFIMKVSSLSLICTSLSYILGKGLLVSMSKDSEYRKATYVSTFVLIMSSLIFIKLFGARGAAYSFIISSVSYLLTILKLLRNIISTKNIFQQILYSITVIFIVVSIVTYLKGIIIIKSLWMGFIIYGAFAVLLSICCYFPVLKQSIKKSKYRSI